MIAAAWPWVLVGILGFLVVGVLAALALGLLGTPSDFLRRLGQTLRRRPRVERGTELPDEVPEADDEREP